MLGTNVGAYITPRFALDRSAFGAGQGGNPGNLNGETFQRTTRRPLHVSGQLQLGIDATLASGNTLAIFAKLQHSDNGSSWTDVPLQSGVSTITALNTGAAQKLAVSLDVNLIGVKDYMRCVVSPTLSASGVDTGEIFGIWALGGGETVPPTEAPA
jgi:hypothetical protein